MPVTTVAIHKGGTGKTTLAIHLAHYLAEGRAPSGQPNRVLLIDSDPQGNATQSMTDEVDFPHGSSKLFERGGLAIPVPSMFPGIMVMPADPSLLDVERLPLGTENVFRENVHHLLHSFDHIVIDTPPTLGFGMLAPLIASDYAFSPIMPDPYSMRGIQSLIDRTDEVRAQYNPSFRFLGLLINKWNKRSADQTALVEAFKKSALSRYLAPYQITERSPISQVAFRRQPVWTVKSGAARVAAKEIRGALGWLTSEMRMSEAA